MTKEQQNEITFYCLLPISKITQTVNVVKRSNKCLRCNKWYKFPAYVFKPRDMVCFTCEEQIRAIIAVTGGWESAE